MTQKDRLLELFQLYGGKLTLGQVDEVAIMKQIPIAHAWIMSNPGRGPKKQVTRFLYSWLSKAKQYGNLVQSPNAKLYQEQKPDPKDQLTYEDIQAMKGSR